MQVTLHYASDLQSLRISAFETLILSEEKIKLCFSDRDLRDKENIAGESDWETSLENIQNWKFIPHMDAFEPQYFSATYPIVGDLSRAIK